MQLRAKSDSTTRAVRKRPAFYGAEPSWGAAAEAEQPQQLAAGAELACPRMLSNLCAVASPHGKRPSPRRRRRGSEKRTS